MPLFKRKSEKRPQPSSAKQQTKPENPAVKNLQQPGKQRQQRPSANSVQHVNAQPHGRGQSGVVPRQRVVQTDPTENIDDGTAALAAEFEKAGRTMVQEGLEHAQRIKSDEENALGDLGTGVGVLQRTDQPINRSRLCKSLNEALHDNGALPYFIQYMASRDRVQLVQFWLSAESFSNASWSKIRTESMSSNPSAVNHVTTTIPEDKGEREDLNPQTGALANQKTFNGKNSNSDDIRCDAERLQNNNEINLPNVERREEMNSKLANRVSGESGTVESEIKATAGSVVNASPNVSPTKSKTHTRARSDSAVGVGKMFGGSDGKGFEPGHRRNNSWKEVDPRTAVERDAINIFTKYICKDASTPIGVPEELRLEIIGKICPKDGQLDPDCFKKAQNYAFEVMDKQYFQSFLRSEFHCKYQIDVLTSGRVYLADILYNDTATFYFMEYLEQENAVHLLQFWLAGENFQQHLLSQQGQYDPIEAQSDAMVLYDQYFSLQATHPIGFNDTIRFEVESNICREGGPLPTCFASPMRQAYTTLETVYFPGFLQSDLYYKFLSELINTIKSEQQQAALPGGGGTSTSTGLDDDQSSTSSEPTKVARNTLLAEGSVVKLFEGDMNIDPVKFDPDSLWQRSKPGGMMFGKVNHLGQFVPEYEPDPELLQKRSSSTKFSLKKLVTKEEDKSKEEMALKIAQMIINDVNLQTQGMGLSDSPSPTDGGAAKLPGT